MKHYDVIIIGAGLMGCFAARSLSKWKLNTLVLERREDVCTGMSRANSGIIYTGYDAKPGSFKASLCVNSNSNFDNLCTELDVPFKRCGSLMAAFGPNGTMVLEKKYEDGIANSVPGLKLNSSEEIYQRFPSLAEGAVMGLYAPGTGTVHPWELGIAAYENAAQNGVKFSFSQPVVDITRNDDGWIVETESDKFFARAVLNCGGLQADKIREFANSPLIRLTPKGGDYLVFDTDAKDSVPCILFHEPEDGSKGLTLIPTVDGHVLAGATHRPEEDYSDSFPTRKEGLDRLHNLCKEVVPSLPHNSVIRNFGALRPYLNYVIYQDGDWIEEDRRVSDFTILQEDGLFSLIGIKTPGLTCAPELGRHVSDLIIGELKKEIDVEENPSFSPIRRGIPRVRELSFSRRNDLIKENSDYGVVVCRCQEITLGEIKDAINRGAVTVDGVKRRVGATAGRCQGSHCSAYIIEQLLKKQPGEIYGAL